MKKGNLIKSLSLLERKDALFPYYSNDVHHIENQLSNWKERKSLCTQKHFEEYTHILGIVPEAFNIGIKKLDNKDNELLWETMQDKSWFKLNQKIIAHSESVLVQKKPVDFSYVIRYHISYFQKEIKEKTSAYFKLDEISLTKIVAHAENDLLAISLKTLVFDLHEQKKKISLKGETARARFCFYLNERFSSVQHSMNFFEEYPVLWRLLAERLQFHLDNYILFIDSIEQSVEALKYMFHLSMPLNMAIDSIGDSDSHEKGKTVILFRINEQKLVFKFKNLVVGQRWNEFLSIIEQETGSAFYKVKRVTEKNYTIEEFVEKTICTSEKEVMDYYYHFGEYTAICYFLCGNDFHAENIIACGSHPVIIDIETLFQNDSPISKVDDIYAKAATSKSCSVLSTSLLPMTYFNNRIEPKVSGRSSGIETNLSGFNGDKQVLPFKVLRLVEENTDNTHFEYIEHYSKENHNIPVLHGQKVDPMKYSNNVMKGFSDQYDFFASNKQVLIKAIKEVFDGSKVRCILKSTQQYYDMLDYGHHFGCMKDHLNRDKLFENLWAFPYKNKIAIRDEIEDLMNDDIPIFFTTPSSKSLFTSSGKEIKRYHSRTAFERVQARIESLNEEDKAYQLVILNSALDNYLGECFNYSLSDSPKTQLKEIVQHILKRAITDTEYQKTLFLDFILENEKRSYGIATINFYDGMTGIYLFLLYYANYYPDWEVQQLIQSMENIIFDAAEHQLTGYSIYSGKLSILVALYYRYQVLKDEASLNQALSLVHEMNKNQKKIDYKVDWLTGVSALIKLLTAFYKESKNQLFIEFAEYLAKKINLSAITVCGLSHGYSGVIVALNTLGKYVKNKNQFSWIIQECLDRERVNFDGKIWIDLRENLNFTSQWCHGCTGIGLARLELLTSGSKDKALQVELEACVDTILTTELDDDCLCHGNAGSYTFLSEVYKSGLMNQQRNHLILHRLKKIETNLLYKGVTLEGLKAYPNLGFMTGLSGIGFNWLRILHPEIPNLLIIE